ncbi:MAG: hypothetical protein A4E59_00374 [Syntrophorhabdus sp. PtaB.Bin027]|nr:MAG: hypothetical protein A4E59_00374 [Syntrophorhabdus sp. PtaB.Bin027]OQB69192.1 MAG: hypothetical protein BWX92_03867 [Deltaproteobacteria bacterium ADurb.Bin135]
MDLRLYHVLPSRISYSRIDVTLAMVANVVAFEDTALHKL